MEIFMKNLLLFAPVFSISGYGAHSRDIFSSLFDSHKFNISLITPGWGGTSNSSNFPQDLIDKINFCNSNIIRKNTDLIYVHVGIPGEFSTPGKYNIGITAGLEANQISRDWVEKSNLMTCLVVPTKFCKNIFEACGVTVPIHVVGEGVDLNFFNSISEGELPLEIKPEFNFLFCGQWGQAGFDRKQVELLINIFQNTFQNDPKFGLILKTYINNISSPDAIFTKNRIYSIVKEKNTNIKLLHGELTEVELGQLYHHPQIKAFISLTSGEGWNRPAAEAVACDLPVMLPDWSGHMDFIKPEYSTVFKTTLVDIPEQYLHTGWFEIGSKWCRVDPTEVGIKMKNIVKYYKDAKDAAINYGVEFRRLYNKEVMYTKLITLLDNYKFDSQEKLEVKSF